jgi:hypothetical protein
LLDESLAKFALQVLEKGGPLAFSVVIIVGTFIWVRVKYGKPPTTGTEGQMTAALRALEDRMQDQHEAAQEYREKMKDDVHSLGERVARIEGQLTGANSRRQ